MVVKIVGIRPGSIIVDVIISIQTKAPDGVMKEIHHTLLSSVHSKYDIQELKMTGGNTRNML